MDEELEEKEKEFFDSNVEGNWDIPAEERKEEKE